MALPGSTWLDEFFKFPGGTFSTAEGNVPRAENIQNISSTFNIVYTGALTATRTVTFPLPADDPSSYNRVVFNNTTGGHDLIISVGVGTTVTLGAGVSSTLVFEPAGVRFANT